MPKAKPAPSVAPSAPAAELRSVEDLIPYARNSRTHSDAQVAQIAASIREFGFMAPVLIDGEGSIIAGHGRVLAARKLQLAQVPVIIHTHLTESQKRAYVIADNKLALNAGWDDELLAVEIAELHESGYALDVLGFDAGELNDILGLDDKAGDGEGNGDIDPQGRYQEQYGVIVICQDSDHQETVFNKLQAYGFNVKVVVT